ncbi:hypothetical protein AYO38_01425 [bacterium SCGC AG-212-C10]|nr:hypothetical protein AYO38_01425 [bacterium SCGC AG-212-C10]
MSIRHPVHYARTSDGLAIPYTMSGAGYPLLELPDHCGLDEHPGLRRFNEALEQRFTRVALDIRGIGLAPRGLARFTIEDILDDITTVIEATALQHFVIFAPRAHALAAIRYAAEHPTNITALILWNSFPPNPPGLEFAGVAAEANFAKANWPEFLRLRASAERPGSEDDLDALTGYFDRQVTPADFATMVAGVGAWDVSEYVPRVSAPALVIVSREPSLTITHIHQVAVDLAEALPKGELAVLPAHSLTFTAEQLAPTLAAIDLFISRRLPEVAPRTRSDERVRPDLSQRERDVLRLIAQGNSSAEIAQRLVISVRTADRHVANIYRKIDAHNRSEATGWALRNGYGGGEPATMSQAGSALRRNGAFSHSL